MERKEVIHVILLVVATLAVTIELVGFFSPGWLCMSAKYHAVISDTSDIKWTDDIANQLDTSDLGRVRRQDTPTPPPSKPLEQVGDAPRGKKLLKNWTLSPSAAQEERVFRDFLRWIRNSSLTTLLRSVPRNVTDFKKWIFIDKANFFTVREYLQEFLMSGAIENGRNMTNTGRNITSMYFQVIQYWLRGAADDPNHPNVLENLSHATGNSDVSEIQQTMIYNEFRAFVNRTVQRQLPKYYTEFVTWLAKDLNRIKKMESRYDYFNTMINRIYPSGKVELYETVIESWFYQALQYNKSANENPSEWFDPAAMLGSGNIQVSVRLGIWYGKECFQDKCYSTDTYKLQKDGFDIGGVATWHNIRIETIFALAAGAVGFVGTLLTVKPFCLKGRQRVTAIIGVIGLILSCILFLVPISRVASINQTLKNNRMYEQEVVQIDMPWAAAVSGIGACLAFLTAVSLAFFTWFDERHKWNRFEEDSAIVFKNDNKPKDETQESDSKAETGTYDNLGTMSNI